jgi:ABC-type oligopeptide transport system substrate-binding subunit
MTINEGNTLTMLGFSMDRSMVELAEIRRALSLAIDREALVQQFFPNSALPVSQFTPDGVASAPNVTNALYNPTQALSFFEMAGFANCAGVPEKVILLVPEDDPVWAEAGLWITQQWAALFGCNPALFEVKPVARTLLVEITHANYDPTKVTRSHIWLTTWTPDYPDANDWLYGALHCHFGYLRLGRSCDGSDENLDAATLEPDPARRADYYGQVEEQLFGTNGTYPVAPLMISVTAWLQQPQVTQVNSAGAARYDLWIIAAGN